MVAAKEEGMGKGGIRRRNIGLLGVNNNVLEQWVYSYVKLHV